MIADKDYDYIVAFVHSGRLKGEALQDDLIDHFCCAIEDLLEEGLAFKAAFKIAYQQISPNGLKEIEIETEFLLHYKKYTIMKKLIFTIGFITSFCASLGSFLKVMHMPGGNILSFSGFIGFAYIFIPMLVYLQYKSNKLAVMRERLKWVIGAVSIILIITGSLFKVLHLQGAAVVFGLGCLTFAFAFLPILFVSMFKQSEYEMVNNQ